MKLLASKFLFLGIIYFYIFESMGLENIVRELLAIRNIIIVIRLFIQNSY